jgi:hypothetical protein
MHRPVERTGIIAQIFELYFLEMKLKLSLLSLFLVLSAGAFFCVKYYSYVFARTVVGKVVDVENVLQPTTIIQGVEGQKLPNQIFSFAIGILDDKGEIVTASSEDRQWAVVKKGQCAEAKFFPYPPWALSKAGTYFGARLLKLNDCN